VVGLSDDSSAKDSQLICRVSEDLKIRLEAEADATGQSMSELLREGAQLVTGDTRSKLERKLRELQEEERRLQRSLEDVRSEIEEVEEDLEQQHSQEDSYRTEIKQLAEEVKDKPRVLEWDGQLRKIGETLNLSISDVREDVLSELGVESVEEAKEVYGESSEDPEDKVVDPYAASAEDTEVSSDD